MKLTILSPIAALVLSISAQSGLAAEPSAATKQPGAVTKEPSAASKELQELVTKVKAKLQEGKKTEADLADELKEFDALLAKHKGEKTDDVAQIAFLKALLYRQVFKDPTKADEAEAQLRRDFPDSRMAKMLAQQDEAKKARGALTAKSKFPDFEEKDLEGKPLSVANYKGKVVLVDFWATWCGPCVHELPNVIQTYGKHHEKGFEIIGISLDQDKQKLTSFIADKKMPWPQFFDGKGWGNKLATKYGIQSIPATFLLDREGKIIGQDLRGEDLEKAVTDALAKN